MILFAGSKISKYGYRIAERTGLGRVGIGVILVASVNSLPELFTSVGSVTIFDAPDMAVGSLLGSCMFNILIIAMVCMLARDVPILTRTNEGLVQTGLFGVGLLDLVVVALMLGDKIPTVGWVGLYSFGFFGLYLIAMRTVFYYELRRLMENKRQPRETIKECSNSRLYASFAFHAILVACVATYLPSLGEQLAKTTGLGQTFVGSLFIALITSMPEVAIAVSALCFGAVDMAIGNLLGSNLFNIGILAVSDIFYTRGGLLSAVTSTHITTALAAVIMSALSIVGLSYWTGRKRLPLSWNAMGLVVVYLAATYYLWEVR